jgi:hypothetical protein
VPVPPGVAALLAGTPEDGAWEAVLPLLTVDPDGYPRVCLLSRAEVEVAGDALRCVVRSRRTTANLRRDGRALLLAVDGVSAHYLHLSLRREAAGADDRAALAVEFAVAAAEEDSRDTPLRPMTFLAGAAVREADRTDRNPGILSRLADPLSAPG